MSTKLFVDCGQLAAGGSIQMGIEFARALSDADDFDLFWRLSPRLEAAMRSFSGGLPERWVSCSSSRWSRIRQLKQIIGQEMPDCIFSVMGPPMISTSPIPHVAGFARGFCLNPESIAWKRLQGAQFLKTAALEKFAIPRMIKNADYYWVETELARTRLLERSGLPRDRIVVTGNTCGEAFHRWKPEPGQEPAIARSSEDEFVLLTVSTWYPHKNLEIIPDVAAALLSMTDRPFRFVLTLDQNDPHWRAIHGRAMDLGVGDLVQTFGRQHPEDLPALYDAADVMFLPTLLETFSASYPEAMASGCAIVTTDLDFAHTICGDSAAFFRPRDAADAARVVGELARDPQRLQELRQAGRARLETFPSSAERGRIVLDLIRRACEERG